MVVSSGLTHLVPTCHIFLACLQPLAASIDDELRQVKSSMVIDVVVNHYRSGQCEVISREGGIVAWAQSLPGKSTHDKITKCFNSSVA